MKKLSLLLLCCLLRLFVFAQPYELLIHQINIGVGDATFIGIYDSTKKEYIEKVLIDGGNSIGTSMLLPYLKAEIGISDTKWNNFDYVILSHYDMDHYKGLLMLGTGKITADNIIDPGGYDVKSIFPDDNGGSASDGEPSGMSVVQTWIDTLKQAKSKDYVKGRCKMLRCFNTSGTSDIGNKIILGQVGGTDVVLQCVAGWGNTLTGSNPKTFVDNPAPTKTNSNNFTLAFILSCGEFRYFTGGDMGGPNQTSTYIDQETPLTELFSNMYLKSVSMDGTQQKPGHICAFKANHHGSNNSNSATFMDSMYPSVAVTSSGNRYNHPSHGYLERLAKVQSLSTGRGFYFTNILNNVNDISLFMPPMDSFHFNYGSDKPDYPNPLGNYVIEVKGDDLKTQSSFRVYRVDLYKDGTQTVTDLATFSCHKSQ